MPPCTCPSASSGLISRPASSTATSWRSETRPVSVSTSTTATWVPNGNVGINGSKSVAAASGPCSPATRSAQPMLRAGVPATWKRPPSSTTSATAASRTSAARCRAASTSWADASATAAPPSCTAREPDGEAAGAHEIGVAVDDIDLLDRHARGVGRDHRPGRVMPLAVRRGPAAHEEPAVLAHLDGAELGARHARRDLDVRGDADAEDDRVPVAPAARLLGAQLVVAGCLQGALERLPVVADVVARADAGRVRLGEAGDEVAPPHLGGVHPDLGGEAVDHALDGDRRLRAAGSAERRGRHGVGDHRDAAEADVAERRRRPSSCAR